MAHARVVVLGTVFVLAAAVTIVALGHPGATAAISTIWATSCGALARWTRADSRESSQAPGTSAQPPADREGDH